MLSRNGTSAKRNGANVNGVYSVNKNGTANTSGTQDSQEVKNREEIPAAIPLWRKQKALKGTRITASDDELETIDYRISCIHQELFTVYLPEVKRIARNYKEYSMPEYSIVDQDDLLQAASFGAYESICRYKLCKVPFLGFAYRRIHGSMIDCLRQMQDFPRIVASQRRDFKEKFRTLSFKMGRNPTPEEFTDHYGEQYRDIFHDNLIWSGVFNNSIKESNEYDEEGSCINPETSDGKGILESYDARSSILACIEDEDIRYVMWAYYWHGMLNRQIANIIGRSISSVADMRRQGVHILRCHYNYREFCELVRK